MSKPTYRTAEDEVTFNLVNADVVRRLEQDGDIKLPKKKLNIPKDKQWNTKQMASKLLQGITNGDSVPTISKSLVDIIGNNQASQIRNARTMVTGAENSGRLDSYKNLDEQGVEMRKVWIATPDDRTRASHLEIDGEEVGVDDAFSNGCMCPGDPDGDPSEVWNCRCSMRSHIVGFKRTDGSISAVNYERDSTMHAEQMAAEKANRASKAGMSARAFIGEAPVRPRRADFDDMDKFFAAREKYHADKAALEERAEIWYSENVNTNPMTVKELEDWCKKNDCTIYGSLDGLDGVTLRNYTERYEKLIEDFPLVKEYHDRMGIPFEIAYDPKALFDAEASHGMTFGGTYSDFHDAFMRQAGISTDEFVYGVNPALRTFDHEFGHQVFFAMQYGKDAEIWNSTTEEINRRIEMQKDLMQSVYGKAGMSDYATTNEDELFAEGFCAWYGGEKTEFAKAFGEFLGRWL